MPVSAEITESTALQPNTTYYFKLVAENEAGTPVEGAEEHFTTLPNRPRVATGEASGVGQTSATVSGTVDPEGAELISCTFEYGTSPSQLGTSVPCSSLPPAGASPVGVSAALARLSPGTTYYYRLVAQNSGGEGAGSEGSFTTAATPSPSPTPTPTRPDPHADSQRPRTGPATGGQLAEREQLGVPGGARLDRAGGTDQPRVADRHGVLVRARPAGRGGRGVHPRRKRAPARQALCRRAQRAGKAGLRAHVGGDELGRRALYGLNKLPFTGRVRGKALRPGAYRATFTAESLAGGSSPATISFRVVAH